MVWAKIKSYVGRIKPSQRYADTSEAETPDEKLDPESWSYDATPGLGERLAASKRTLVMYGAFMAVVAGVLVVYAREFVVGVVSNPLLQTSATYIGLLGFGIVVGTKLFQGRIRDWDWLVLQLPDGVVPMLGDMDTTDDGTTVFVPYAGIDWLGFRSRQLQLGELGSTVARTFAKRGRDMDSGARIRVDDAISGSQDTAYGRITAVLADGLEVDEFGQHSDVYTKPPETVDTSQYELLRRELEKYSEKVVPQLLEEVEVLEAEIERLQQHRKESDDDAIGEFISHYERVERARQSIPDAQAADENPDPDPDDDTPPATVPGSVNGGGPA